MAGSIRTIIKNSIFISGGLIAANICSLLFRLIIARVYGPSSFGVFSIGFMFVSISTTIAVLGLPAAVTRFVSQYRSDGNLKKIPTVLIIVLLLTVSTGTILSAGLAILGKPLATQLFNSPESSEFLNWFVYQIPANVIIVLTAAFALGFERGEIQVAIREVSPKIFVLGFSLVFVASGGTILQIGVGYVAAQWVTAIIGIATSVHLLRTSSVPNFSLHEPILETRKLLVFSVPLLFTTFTGFFLNWIDTFFVAYYLTDSEVGIYQVAFLLGSSLSIFFTAIGQSLFPNFSALLAEGDFSQASQRYIAGTRWGLIISAAPFYYLLTFPDSSLSLIFGTEYSPASVTLVVILLGQMFSIVCGPGTEIVKSKGHTRFILMSYILAAVVNIVANVILIPVIGLAGAAAGTSVGISLQALLLFSRSRSILDLQIPVAKFGKVFISGALTSSLFYILPLQVDSWTSFVFSITAFSVTYFIFSFIFGGIKQGDVLWILNSV